MSENDILVEEIYKNCLIENGENFYVPSGNRRKEEYEGDNYYYLPGPIKIRNNFFDPSVVSHNAKKIKELEKVKEILNVSSQIKLLFLSQALLQLDKSVNYKEAYRCKIMDRDINSLLSFFGMYCTLRNDTSCYIFYNDMYVEASIAYNDVEEYLIAFGFEDDIEVEITVNSDFNYGVTKEILFTDNKAGINVTILLSDMNNGFFSTIIKSGEIKELYKLIISDHMIQLETKSSIYEESIIMPGDEPAYDSGDKPEVESEEPVDYDSSNEENEEENYQPPVYYDGDITRYFIYNEGNSKSNKYPLQVGELSMEAEQIKGGFWKLTHEEMDDQEMKTAIFHPRNIELLDVVLKELDENINGIQDYLKKRYPLIEHYKGVNIPISSGVEEIMDDIYNPDCDFDQKKLFKGEERIK